MPMPTAEAREPSPRPRNGWDRPPLRHALLFAIALQAAAWGEEAEPLRVEAQVRPGTYYVGQAIELRVGVVGGGERPRVGTPQVRDADVAATGTEFRPVSTSAIGGLVAERNLYLYRFRLLPRRPGTLRIPAIVARLGPRSGSSRPVQVKVRDVPTAGRPEAFLGGVGPFELRSEAEPASVRAGQELEFRITVIGPAARGMDGRPELRRLDSGPLGLRIDALPTEAVPDPPSCVFRFRIRPTRAGEWTIPPVAVAAFDPKLERFVTKVTASVPIRVVDVPRFDPGTLRYPGSTLATPRSRTPRPEWVPALSTLMLVGAASSIFAARRLRARRGRDWLARRLLARLARELGPVRDPAQAGRRITEGLAEYLHLMAGRPTGALTPGEAAEEIAGLTEEPELGGRADRLVSLCDQAQYDVNHVAVDDLVGEGRRLLEELERRLAGGGEKRPGSGGGSGNTGRGSTGRPDGMAGGRILPLQDDERHSDRQTSADSHSG